MSYTVRAKIPGGKGKGLLIACLVLFLALSSVLLMQRVSQATSAVNWEVASEALEEATRLAFTFPAHTNEVFLLEDLILLQHKAGNTLSEEKIVQQAIERLEGLSKRDSPGFADISNPPDLTRRVPLRLEIRVPYTFYSFMRIANLQIKIGHTIGIRATLQKARRLVNDTCKELQKIGCLQMIAVAEARRGDQAAAASTLQELIDTAARLKSGRFFQVYPIVAVAQAQAEKGEKALARASLNQALSNITDCGTFDGACEILEEACVVAAKLGDEEFLEALLKRTFVAIDKRAEKDAPLLANSKKVIVLMDVSKVQSPEHARESIKRALGIMKTIPEEQLKSAAYMRITVVQAQLNDLREARESFDQIKDDEENRGYRVMAAPYLAEAMIRAGEVDEALELVNEIHESDLPRRLWIMGAVGVAKAEQGDIDGAVRIKQRINKLAMGHQMKVLSAVGKQKAKNGSPSEVLKWAKAQPSNLDKIYALMGVAEGLLEKAEIAIVE